MDELVFRVLKGHGSASEGEAVNAWRNASAANEEHYRLLAAMLAAYAEVEEARSLPEPPSIAEVIAREKWSATFHLPRSSLAGRTRRSAFYAAGAAALVLLGLGIARVTERAEVEFGTQEFVTGRAERSAIRLHDGTVVRLGPDSRLTVAPGRDQREVSLNGRAYFAVAKAAGRPFTIHTIARDVVVLGTRFDVESREEDLQVVVVEGTVAIGKQQDPATITVPEGVMYRVVNGVELPTVSVPDALPFVEWTGDFLAFQSTPLSAAVREIERTYSVRVEIQDSLLDGRLITAWFTDRPLEDVLRVVCLAVAAHCVTDQSVVRMTRADG